MTDTEIGHELHIPRQTISSFLTCLETRHSSENLSRPGRPRITTKAQDKRIIAAAETNTRVPFASLQNIINVPASTSTIRRRLHEDLIRKWRAVKRPLLRKEHAKKRLEWALKYQPYTREDWAKIAWSDESASTSLGFSSSNSGRKVCTKECPMQIKRRRCVSNGLGMFCWQ